MTSQMDQCERLAQALLDGNFLEDPVHWREHVERCRTCKRRVEGYFVLRGAIEQARMDAASDSDSSSPERLVHSALAAVRTEQRSVQGVRPGLVAAAAVGVAAIVIGVVATLAIQAGRRPTSSTALDYAKELHLRVFPPGESANLDLLKENAELRKEYTAALDHTSSLVRRTALYALTNSGVDLEAQRVEHLLRTWDETLDTDLEVAAAEDGARWLRDALSQGRVETLRRVLEGACLQVTRGGETLSAELVEGYVAHPRTEIRQAALCVLAQTSGYEPSQVVQDALSHDTSEDVRVAAAECLILRLGDPGAARVVGYLERSSDYGTELYLVAELAKHRSGLALAKRRRGQPDLPLRLALAYARILLREEGLPVPNDLIARGLEDPGSSVHHDLASLASEANLNRHRNALQIKWRAAARSHVRTAIGGLLVRWDLRDGSEERLHMALEIVEMDPGLNDVARELASSRFESVRTRARELLEGDD